MKKLYKIMLIFIMFELTIIFVNLLAVFPYTLYSEADVSDISNISDPAVLLGKFFTIPAITISNVEITEEAATFTFYLFISSFFIVGAAIAKLSGDWTLIITTIIGMMFVPMILRSRNLFEKLFVTWETPALSFMVILIFVGLLYIALITIVETPTHGRS